MIQLVGFGRKTGVLSVEHQGAGSKLYFAEGNVIHAVSAETEGEEAVYELFRVEEGQFRFQAEVEPPRQTIFMDPTNLVMEAARLLDEHSREKAEKKHEEPEIVSQETHGLPSAEQFEGSELFGSTTINDINREEIPAGPPVLTPDAARREITELLEQKFGKDSKRLTQAVSKCGDTVAEFQELAVRIERFVSAFVDPKSAGTVGNELREIVRRLPGGS